MKPYIKFYLEDETLHYNINKSFGKVVFQNQQNVFVFEVESTDELDHVEGDSLQNEFPEVILSIEEFPIQCSELKDLISEKIYIPNSVEEVENEEGEMVEIYYTNLNLNDEEDLETNENTITFSKDENNNICLLWKGTCDHFEQEDQPIQFEVYSKVNFKKDIKDFDE